MITATYDKEESIKKMGVGGNKNQVEVVNATIDMYNNTDGGKDGKDGEDGSKDDEYCNDGDGGDDEDGDNDDGEDNYDKNNSAVDSEQSDNGKGKNDTGIGSFVGLDERGYAAI